MPPATSRWHKPIYLNEIRFVHSGAWWLWAILMATMAAGTTNPIFLISIICVVLLVVKYRKSDAPWSRSIKGFIFLATAVITLRLLLVVITPDIFGDTLLFKLPEVNLPSFFVGVKLGGEIKANTVYFAFMQGLKLGTILICIGAAQSLASPTRLLKSVPAALYEVGLALIVAMTFAPQLAQDAKRVRDAQYLRGRKIKGIKALAKTFVPVLEGAMERALLLASAMDSRGYGRRVHQTKNNQILNNLLMLLGLLGILFGMAGLLGVFNQSRIGLLTLVIGISFSFVALWFAGKNASRTKYRPDQWHIPEVLVITSAIFGLVALRFSNNIVLNPTTSPLIYPQVDLIALAAIWVALLAIPFSPRPPKSTQQVSSLINYQYETVRTAA
jgi:energy-coupling factor transport system permease protein